MRGFRVAAVAWVAAAGVFTISIPEAAQAASHRSSRQAPASTGATVLTATNTGPTYAPTFTGNGVLGVRVPPAGQGYAPGTVPAQSELAGFYAQPPGDVQKRANTPTWSTLQFTDGGSSFDPADGHTSGWQQ